MADGFESDEPYGLATRMKSQRSNSLNSKTLERTGNISDPATFSSDIEDMEIEATKATVEPTAAHDAYNVIVLAKFEDDFDTLKHNTQPSARAYNTQSASSKSQIVSINLYCGKFVQLRSIIMKRAERFEILTRVICEQEQIPRHELRFMWKSGVLDLDATPDSLGMGQEEEVYLYRELAGSFQTIAWYNKLIISHRWVAKRRPPVRKMWVSTAINEATTSTVIRLESFKILKHHKTELLPPMKLFRKRPCAADFLS